MPAIVHILVWVTRLYKYNNSDPTYFGLGNPSLHRQRQRSYIFWFISTNIL